jgi:hypothetical protein
MSDNASGAEQRKDIGPMERRRVDEAVRRARIVQGAGSGTAIGSSLAILFDWAYATHTGNLLPSQVAIALGAVIGSLSSTVTICLQDIRALVWAAALRRREGDRRKRRDDDG